MVTELQIYSSSFNLVPSLLSQVGAESRDREYFRLDQPILQDQLDSAHLVHKVPVDVLIFELIEHVSTLLLELFCQTTEELTSVFTLPLDLQSSLEEVLLYFTFSR